MEAPEKCVAMIEDVLVHAGLREVRPNIRKTNEEMFTIWGKWEVTTVKPQELGSEVVNVPVQIQTISQELTTKLNNDRALLMKQIEQVGKVEITLGEI